MSNDNLKELYVEELKDLYSAENQLVKALPKMAKAASSGELRQGFEKHLEQTKGHVQRLEKVFQALEESPKGKKCKGMEGLIEEGAEVMEENFEDSLMEVLSGHDRSVVDYRVPPIAHLDLRTGLMMTDLLFQFCNGEYVVVVDRKNHMS
jgi:ferritin-like metal-binding protein YciE